MSVTIFLPSDYFYIKENCYIYGDIKICENNVISYYIIQVSSILLSESCQKQRLLGHIINAEASIREQNVIRDAPLTFTFDPNNQSSHIHLKKLSIKPAATTSCYVNLFLYNKLNILNLQFGKSSSINLEHQSMMTREDGDSLAEETDLNNDFHMLYMLLSQYSATTATSTQHRNEKSNNCTVAANLLAIPSMCLTKIFFLLMDCKLVRFLIGRTTLYKHYEQWRSIHKTGLRNINIILDRLLGVCVMLLLLWYIAHPTYGDLLIQSSHTVINQLRRLLQALKGSPVGLKLNVHLNNFFLDCFNYHIDLWATFLDLIEPLVRQLILPISLLGSLGFTYQLALLSDLISVVALHAHCFYIYTEVMYKVVTKALQILWKMVLGKRWNKLKYRMESFNFMDRQLYLATIFFSSMLFLFPTILVYFGVFAILRAAIFTVCFALQYIREQILKFPIELLCKWMCGKFYELNSLKIKPVNMSFTGKYPMCIFELEILSGSLGRAYAAGKLNLNT